MTGHPFDRRRFIFGSAAMVGAAALGAGCTTAADPGPTAPTSTPPVPSLTGKRRVAILGGGCGGMSAAMELLQRGFQVDLYERYDVPGGKCRTIYVPNTGTGGRTDLPGEHGFRFFPGYYQNVTDSMSRIPFGSNAHGVLDNLVFGSTVLFSRVKNKGITFPYKKLLTLGIKDLKTLVSTVEGVLSLFTDLSASDIGFFVARLLEFATSCDARRDTEWDNISWWNYVQASSRDATYQNLLASGLTRNLVAAQAKLASTRTIGLEAVRILLDNIVLSMYAQASRVLDGPTSEQWIDPWMTYLQSLGLNWHPSSTLTGLQTQGNMISGAVIQSGSTTKTVTADFYVLAVPVEQAQTLLDSSIRAIDPNLAKIDNLITQWMTGAQFFLSQKTPITDGFVTYTDSPWALTSVSEGQFWKASIPQKYGNGQVQDVLSVDISNWNAPGVVYGKTAMECTEQQIFTEVWTQITQSLKSGVAGGPASITIPDSALVDQFLDTSIVFGPDGLPAQNQLPLFISTVGSLANRPNATTALPNLFLASDYVNTFTDLATMEGANEAARRAVIGILNSAGWSGTQPTVFDAKESALLAPFKLEDQLRYDQGLPNLLAAKNTVGSGSSGSTASVGSTSS